MSLLYLENLWFNTETSRLLTFKQEITTSISAFGVYFEQFFKYFLNLVFWLFKIFLSFYFFVKQQQIYFIF